MEIILKAGGALVPYLPDDAQGNNATLSVGEHTSIDGVLSTLGIPAKQRLMVILNGAMIQRPDYATAMLSAGDRLSLMPPIQAG